MRWKKIIVTAVVSLGYGLLLTPTIEAAELNPNHPQRYVVKKGDTLWGIAGQFLQNPWQWREIWLANDQIAAPDLIYPGDVLVLSTVDGTPKLRLLRSGKTAVSSTQAGGRPTVKLSPAVRATPLRQAIPTIPPDAIFPFIHESLVITAGELDSAPHILTGIDDSVILGNLSQFYARGLANENTDYYQIYRPGRPFIHPTTKEILGLDAIYLGEARLLEGGESAKLEITSARKEIGAGDRLLPRSSSQILPTFHPGAPENMVSGLILSAPDGVSELGSLSTAVISLGERDGVEPGHVLRILRHRGSYQDQVDGKQYPLPDEESGLLMVFRAFEKVSYALVVESTRAVHINDIVETP